MDELWRLLGLPDDLLPAARRAAERFPLLVPRRFAALMRPGDVDDPLLRQVLPLADEFYESPGFSADPLDESGSSPVPGLLHKYQGRALLVVTGSCAVNCRFCFRRHFPYQELPYGPEWWRPAFDHLRRDPTLHEIILSGGDPLMLPDHQLALLAKEAADIPHIQRLRIHSRLPVVLPERVDEALLAWLTGSRLATVLVLHANHAREISAEVESACKRLRRAGVVLLNQSVLLAGVNDDAAVLAALSERLAACGVMPYYLHALDHVQGTAHFLVDDGQAKKLSEELSRLLPGWLVPRLVREVPGAPGKMPVP